MVDATFNPFTLEGKTILVTGASAGIGKSIAVMCSRAGARVVITGRNQARLDATLEEMYGDGHLSFAADLTSSTSLSCLLEQVPELDGIVHCAGVGQRKPCKMITAADVNEVMDINFKSGVLLQAGLLKNRKMKKESSIVFMASRAASSPSVGNAIYSASKGAIISYAKCLSLELAPRQIRVNCICPAMVWTDLILNGGLSKEDLEAAQLNYPLKRYGKPEDVAYLSVYLLSNASSWMTGSCLDLTGGGE